MFGMLAKITATNGDRDELIVHLLGGANELPGCVSYVVAKDLENDNTVWVSEVWASKESHAASLELDSVRTTIERARPLIAAFDMIASTEPVGGILR